MALFKAHALSLGAVISLLSGAALATASSSATLGNLSIQFIDLDTSDGITPGIIFNDLYDYQYGSYASASAYTYDPVLGVTSSYSDGQYSPDIQPFGNAAVSGGGDMVSASASVTGAGQVTGPHTLASAGSAFGGDVPGGYSTYSASASAPTNYYYTGFSLTANTLAIFSATADLAASTTVGLDPLSGLSESSLASYTMAVSGSSPDGSNSQSSTSSLGLSAAYEVSYTYDPVTGEAIAAYLPQSFTQRAQSAVTFVNLSEADITGYFYASTSVSGSSYLSGVPEPESPLLALAGACLAALARLSRNSRNSRSGQ